MSVALRPNESRLISWLGATALVGGIAFAFWYLTGGHSTNGDADETVARVAAPAAPPAHRASEGVAMPAPTKPTKAANVGRAGKAAVAGAVQQASMPAPAPVGATAPNAGKGAQPAAGVTRRRDTAPAPQLAVRQAVRQRALAARPAPATVPRVEAGRVGSLRADIARYNAERGEASENRRWSAAAGAESSWVNNPQSYDSIYRN